MINPNNQLPTIVNMESIAYIDLCMAGYTPIKTGTRREMEEIESDMMEEFCLELEFNKNETN